MISKLLEMLTGKDDLERVASRDRPAELMALLKSRQVLIPRRPRRFLDADEFSPEQLSQLLKHEAQTMTECEFEPWILEVKGKKRLPAFSSEKRMANFSRKISSETNKVFALCAGMVLLPEFIRNSDVDFVDLNACSPQSWEICVTRFDSK